MCFGIFTSQGRYGLVVFFQHIVDKESRLANFVWIDSQSWLDYECFGDVLVFEDSRWVISM